MDGYKPLGYYGMARARDRASLMFFLMQGTACEFLRNKAEPGPWPSGCQRQVQAMSDLSQTLFVSKGHLARPLPKEGVSQDLEPWGEIKMSQYCASWQRWLMERPCSSEGKPFLQPPFQGCNYPPAASVPPLALMSPRRNNFFLSAKAYRQKLIILPHRLMPGGLELLQIALVFLGSLVQGIGTALLWGQSAGGVRETRGVYGEFQRLLCGDQEPISPPAEEEQSRPTRSGQDELQAAACHQQFQSFVNFVMPSAGKSLKCSFGLLQWSSSTFNERTLSLSPRI